MSEPFLEISEISQNKCFSKKTKQRKPSILFDIIEESKNIIEQPKNDDYSILRNDYRSHEYIPSKFIPCLMNHYFKSSELLMQYNENHGIYKIKVKDLLVNFVTNWEYNRPPDMQRCPDIARYIYTSKKQIDTMIHLTYNNLKETFEVLDGIHRITALNIIKEENSKPQDLAQGDFGSDNDASWLYDYYIIVNIRFNAHLGELIEVFKNLNKSQTVSELYICDHSKQKKDIIETIVNEWYFKYKAHFSSSANPVTGNTNITKFTNLLLHLYDKHKIRESSSEKLKKLLENANIKISGNIPSKVSIDAHAKCIKTGCYLFLLKNDVLENFI